MRIAMVKSGLKHLIKMYLFADISCYIFVHQMQMHLQLVNSTGKLHTKTFFITGARSSFVITPPVKLGIWQKDWQKGYYFEKKEKSPVAFGFSGAAPSTSPSNSKSVMPLRIWRAFWRCGNDEQKAIKYSYVSVDLIFRKNLVYGLPLWIGVINKFRCLSPWEYRQ